MTTTYYYLQNGQQFGPVSDEQLKAAAAQGRLRRDDLVWHEGLPNWSPAGTIQGLFPPSTAPSPAPPGTPARRQPPPRAIPVGAPVAFGGGGVVMEVVSGAASHVRRDSGASGNQHGVWTYHITTLRIDRQAVQITMPSPPAIEEGDEVVVAGRVEDGTLHARAYLNRSNGTHGRWAASLVRQFIGYTCLGLMFAFGAGMALAALTGIYLLGLIALPLTWAWYYRSEVMPELEARRALVLVRGRG